MILSNVSVPLLGMVDTGVTGHLDHPAYLGAVAVGSSLFGFLFVGFNFLRMGTTGIAAQFCGAKDNDGLRTSLGQAIVTALLIAGVLLLTQKPIGAAGLYLLGPGADVAPLAAEYFSIRIWSAPATLTSYALIGWFIGVQNARVPLLIVVTTNLTNVVLDLLFVLGLGMTVDGVALASVIAETMGVVVGIAFAARELGLRKGKWRRNDLLQPSAYARFFAVNGHLFVRTIALVSTFTFVTAQGARLGGLVLAANAVLMNLQTLLAFALDGFAHAAEALVGKAVGEKSREAISAAVSISLRWSLYVALLFAILFAVGGSVYIRMITNLDEVRDVALRFLPWMIASPLVSVWSFLYDGVFVGATAARAMRDIMLVSTFLVFLPSWLLFRELGNHGLWLAFLCFMAARGVGMHVYYRRRLLPEISALR